MADYISGTSSSRAPLFLGIAAVGIVIVLGLVAFGGGTGETDLSPGVALDAPAPGASPDAAPVLPTE